MLSELRCRLTRSRRGRRGTGRRRRWRPRPGRKGTWRPLSRRGILPELRALRGRESLLRVGRQSQPELLLLLRAAKLVIRGCGRRSTRMMPVRHRSAAVRETVSAHRRRCRGPIRRVARLRRVSERRTRRSTVWNAGRRRSRVRVGAGAGGGEEEGTSLRLTIRRTSSSCWPIAHRTPRTTEHVVRRRRRRARRLWPPAVVTRPRSLPLPRPRRRFVHPHPGSGATRRPLRERDRDRSRRTLLRGRAAPAAYAGSRTPSSSSSRAARRRRKWDGKLPRSGRPLHTAEGRLR